MPRRHPDDLDDYHHTDPAYEETRTYRGDSAPDDNSHDIIIENGENGVTRKIKLDLEVDATAKDLGPNPFSKIIHLARAFDSWRPFPRLFITVYIYLLYEVVRWAMVQETLTLEQSGLVSIIVGAGAAWFGLYVGSGRGPKE
jgi:hypothetical protein